MISKVVGAKNHRSDYSIDLNSKPLIDHNNFNELLKSNIFGKYYKIASDMNKRGFAKINFQDQSWSDLIEKVRENLETFFCNNKDKSEIRYQDIFLNKDLNIVKQIALYPEIIKILFTIYGRQPFPFQTLNFRKGSEQHFHSDAVHFNSLPKGFMCGIWVALEDISEKSGPLIYFPKSHKLPYLSSKSLNIKKEDILSTKEPQLLFESYWREIIKKENLKEEIFIPKKGDIIIWHANLIHGGSKQINPDLTRWSQVTHYFFKKCCYCTPFFDTLDGKMDTYWRNPIGISLTK